jgi:hypothetical protein
MSSHSRARQVPAVISTLVTAVFPVTLADAQTIGTFRWQLQPFCNILTLAVTQIGAVYRVEGTDDQCGAGSRASAIGTAFPNSDGSIGMGLNIVVAPGGIPLHVDATLSLSNLSGTWRDSAGSSGPFVFTPGAAVPGGPRPGGLAAVTGIAAGAGLTGGGTAGTVSLAVSFAGSGAAATVAHSDHTHAFSGPLTENTAVGSSAMGGAIPAPNLIGNTAVGHEALAKNAGNYNTAVGGNALEQNTSGLSNVGIGYGALASNVSASANTAVGMGSLQALTTGAVNTALGQLALSSLEIGSANIAIGHQALRSATGSNNIGIGNLVGLNLGPGDNNIYIGNSGFAPDNNTIRIGNPFHVGTVIAGIAGQISVGGGTVLINAGGRMGTVPSLARFKTAVAPIGDERRQLHALRPVRFVYKPEYGDDPGQVQFGLIAEEVEVSFPELLARDEQGEPWTVRYHLLTPLLLAEVQRLERQRADMERENQDLRERLERIERRLDGR